MKSSSQLWIILQAAHTLLNDYTVKPTIAHSKFSTFHASKSNCFSALTER